MMRRFSEVIDGLELRDLPLQGGPFTWSGGLNSQTMSRIDHFLVMEDWEGYFNGVVQSALSRPVSDHFPILLDGGGVRRGPVPFRFENMWLQEEGFKDLLGGWWQGLRFSGSFSFILAEKLKALKVILKSWNKEVFGKVGVNKKLAWIKWISGIFRRRAVFYPWRSWRLERRQKRTLKNGFSWRKFLGGKNQERCG